MKLSTKSRYGLRILLQIALSDDEKGAVKGKVISKKQDISEPYLEQIMIPFKNAGIIRTIRGCNGGYVLNRDPKDVTVLDIIELFEGKLQLVKCVDENYSCSRKKICPTSDVWSHLSQILKVEAEKITLDSLVEEANTKNKPEYVI